MNIEALLIASGQNVKRLLAFGGLRPKKLAQAAALRPPAATSHTIQSCPKTPREGFPWSIFQHAGPVETESPRFPIVRSTLLIRARYRVHIYPYLLDDVVG